MPFKAQKNDRFGLVRPSHDAHTLGLSAVEQLLHDCGYRSVSAEAPLAEAFDRLEAPDQLAFIERWLQENRITVLGFSFRLDPQRGAALFARLVQLLKAKSLLAGQGGRIRALFFAGLPQTCQMVRHIPEVTGVFGGDETPAETVRILGISPQSLPSELIKSMGYDDDRLSFGKDLIAKGEYLQVLPLERGGYKEYGSRSDSLVACLRHRARHDLLPIMRAHVGPYLPDRQEAVQLFLQWCRQLADWGFLDVLSIGTSQLTQSHFGEDWGDMPNGGGVPLNSAEEYRAVWEAARPMLVRTYAGTKNIPALARMHEETINIAWHALSFWWFCQVDGRGLYSVQENLRQHFETLKYIAATGKPFEPNVPHHFAFRGADDVSCIVSAVIAAKVAKSLGIRHLILQNMLNTPKYTWGIQDLAKSRAMLKLVRELADEHFMVTFQPRGGLDYFSPDLEKAKAQLAAVTALMDDIEPRNPNSPAVIHVVSYCEASHLADPQAVKESIQITRHALNEYRRLRDRGEIDDMSRHQEVTERTNELVAEASVVLSVIEMTIRQPYSPEGLYQIFRSGFLPVPYLWGDREEFQPALQWPTKVVRGSVKVVDKQGIPIPVMARMRQICRSENLCIQQA